jgi:hypothetical protein
MRSLLPLVALTVACGSHLSPPERGVYPAERFLVAEGEGPHRAAAEQSARARIAEQISAHIEARFEVQTQSHQGQEDQRIQETVRSSTAFAHAELIEITHTHCEGDRCTATAVLRRARADAVLAQAYAEPAARFRREAEAATRADSIVGFTRHLRGAEAAWPALAPLAAQRQVILGGAPDEVAADRKRRATLLEARDRRLAALRLAVLPGDLTADPVAQPTQAALATALTRLGLAARTADGCSEGPRCTLDLAATLQPCPGGAPLATLDLRGAKLVGASPHGEAAARARLAERVTAERLQPVLAEPVRALLPLP